MSALSRGCLERRFSGSLQGMVPIPPPVSLPAEAGGTRTRGEDQRLLDDFPALVWQAGPDAQCFYFNRTWLLFTGRTLEQELGDGWAEGIHPEDSVAVISTYLEAFGRREPFVIRYRLRRR